jgi:hypothetical protein
MKANKRGTVANALRLATMCRTMQMMVRSLAGGKAAAENLETRKPDRQRQWWRLVDAILEMILLRRRRRDASSSILPAQ